MLLVDTEVEFQDMLDVVKWKKSKVMVVCKGGEGLKWNIDGAELSYWKHLGILGSVLVKNYEGTSTCKKAEEWIGKVLDK